jgi:uncharacterized membrane protein
MLDALQPWVLDHFLTVKTVHVISAFLWAFSTITPMMFYVVPTIKKMQATPEDPELKRRGHWVLEQMDSVVILEHLALILLLGTGLLLYSSGIVSFATGWFKVKMIIVIGFFIPLEIFDIWFSHVKAPRMTREKDHDPGRYEDFRAFYYKYLVGLAPPIVLTVPTVLILALAKPF